MGICGTENIDEMAAKFVLRFVTREKSLKLQKSNQLENLISNLLHARIV